MIDNAGGGGGGRADPDPRQQERHGGPLPSEDYAYGPMVVLGGGLFLMSEVPLYRSGNRS